MDTAAVLSMQLSNMEIISQNVRAKLDFLLVVQDTLSADTLANLVSLRAVALPTNADSVVFDVYLHGKNAGLLAVGAAASLPIALNITPANNGEPITVAIGVVPANDVSRQRLRLALPLQSLRSQTVSLAPLFTNLDFSKARGYLLHVYEVIDESQAPKAPSPLVVDDDERNGRTALRVHPNPFNPVVSIQFAMSSASNVSVRIYDLNGRLVRQLIDGEMVAGEHTLVWDSRDDFGNVVASGVYLAELVSPSERQLVKMTLVR